MKKAIVTLSLLFTSLITVTFSGQSLASCAFKQDACEAGCKIRYFNDSLGKMGCMAECVAERAVCSTKEGAEEAAEKTKKLLED